MARPAARAGRPAHRCPRDPGPCEVWRAVEDPRLRRRRGLAALEVAGRFAEIEQATRARIPPLIGDGDIRYAAFWDWLDTHLPGEPCWFLDLVGVASAAQRPELGRTLEMHGLQRAQADGRPAFLETGPPAQRRIVSVPRPPDRRRAASPETAAGNVVHANPRAHPRQRRSRRCSGGAGSLPGTVGRGHRRPPGLANTARKCAESQICTALALIGTRPTLVQNGGYARAGADRALITQCHPALGPMARGSPNRAPPVVDEFAAAGRRRISFRGAFGCLPVRWCARLGNGAPPHRARAGLAVSFAGVRRTRRRGRMARIPRAWCGHPGRRRPPRRHRR
jgi:hypothetical protein